MNLYVLPSTRSFRFFSLLLIAIVCLLAYSNTFHVPFQLDDTLNISAKPYVRDIGAFLDPAKIEHYRADDPFRMRMAAYFTFAVNYRLHGNKVVGYHVVNLAIHILNGMLVYFFVLMTFRTPHIGRLETRNSKLETEGRGIALFAALLFVSHPVQTEAVTYIVQRIASLATFFYLLSLVAYIKWRLQRSEGSRAGTKNPKSEILNSKFRWRSAVWYLSSLVSAVLAMKTKEIAFTLPVMIALYEFLFFGGTLRKRVLYLLPLLLTMLIIPIERMGLETTTGAKTGAIDSLARASSDMNRWDYLFTEFRVIVTYIRLLFFPMDQNLDYDYPLYHNFFDPHVLFSFLFLSALFGTAVYLLYRSGLNISANRSFHPLSKGETVPPLGLRGGDERVPAAHFRIIAFGIFWFFITLSVESSVIPITDVIFEHRVYLPSVGPFISAATGVSILLERAASINRGWAKIGVGTLGLIIVILSGATYARNNLWTDEVKLWEDVVRKSPSKVRPHINLGYAYGKQGRLEEAAREYQTALRLDPADFQVHNNLGVIYKEEGRVEEAVRQYRTAVRLKPEDAMAYYNLGNIFREQGDFEAAIKNYQTAIRLKPEIEVALIHNNLGIAFIGQGNKEAAAREFRIALDLDPGYEAARRNLEMLLGGKGG